ncbi:MAG TPA: PA2778 family cysteine peptidase [Ramlibacter sp.]|nr:PA2778 family cysteine peptidase [Ramlibacter sp.]
MSVPHRTARLCAGFLCWLMLGLLVGCAQLVPQTVALRTGWPQGVPETVVLGSVPFFPQEDYQCGPAALATVLAYSGVAVTPEPLVSQVFLPARQGSLQIEMLAAPRRYDRVAYQLEPRYADLLREVAAGNPVVVLQDVGPMFTQWHYAVVNGFDYPSGTIWLRSGTKAREALPFTAFERTWIKSSYWAMVVAPPDRIPVSATETRWMSALLAMARAGGAQAATKGYEAALKRWPDSLPAAVGLANQHHAGGAYDEAVAVLRAAQLRHPQSVIVINNLAQALSDQGRHAEALAQISKASDPQSPFAGEVRSTRQLILQRIAQQKAGNRR